MKIKGRTTYNGNIFETVLRNRGIEDIELFLKPSPIYVLDKRIKEKIEEGIKLLIKHLEEGNLIIMIVDSDVDGMTSSAILYKNIKRAYPNANLKYVFHNNKAHGFTEGIMGYIELKEPKLIICADAGTNDFEQIGDLKFQGIDVLVIDHHEIDTPSDDCILINNQLDNCENDKLTGAGMAYRFCEEFNKYLGLPDCDDLLELTMMGLIGDSADVINNEVRYLCDKGKSSIKQEFIMRAINEKKYNIHELSYVDISFGVIPLINAVCRIGTIKEKEIVFKALADIDTDFEIVLQKKKLNKETRKYEMKDITFDLYNYALDICKTVKTRQDKFVDNFIKKTEIDNSGDVIVVTTSEDLLGLTGLIANKIASEYSKPTLVLQELFNSFSGSGRGCEKIMPSLKDWCEKTGLFDLVQGHSNAHGVILPKKNIDKLFELTRDIGEKQEIEYEVDFIYDDCMPTRDIEIIHKGRDVFGGGNVKEPQFGIVNMVVPKENIQLKGNSTLKIYYKGVYFTKFKSSKEEYEAIVGNFNSHVTFNLVCRVSVNFYNGNKYCEGNISAFEYNVDKQENEDEDFEIYF